MSATKMTAAPDLGQTRVNFSYDNYGSTTADFCDKSKRQYFGEGPHEDAWKRWLSVNTNVTDFQFQPLKADFLDDRGDKRTVFWDVAIELLGTAVIIGEIKADRRFFDIPKVDASLRLSVAALRDENIFFVRLLGTDFDDITRDTIKAVFDRRRTRYEPHLELRLVCEALEAGTLTLGAAAGLMKIPYPEAEAKLCAMMCHRRLAIDLELPLTPDTVLRPAPAAHGEGALRRFLERCREPA